MKHDLTDTTFIILIRLDSVERLENLKACVSALRSSFDTVINVRECASNRNGFIETILQEKVNYSFMEDKDPILYRTRCLNRMVHEVTTPYVAVWDADVIAPAEQILDSVDALRKEEADFAYPYAKYFMDTSMIIREMYLQKDNDIEFLLKNRKRMQVLWPPNPVGGAFFCNVKSYKESGLENERFYGWGMEDGERYNRWDGLGYRIKRIDGPLFHLSHPKGINSIFQNSDQRIVKFRLIHSSCRVQNRKIFERHE
jgi:predicted glycosyltransferase involved in capsule biosynthesis